MRTEIKRCACGKRCARFASRCKACDQKQRADCVAEATAVVRTGRCPRCGAGLRRNLSMAGWWQCQQYGAEGFRADASKPACPFQCFTE